MYKLVIEFSKRLILKYEKSKEIENILSVVLGEIFKVNEEIKLENRSIVKHFLLKLVKKFGRNKV
jgi:glycine cleavage system H lipoate-binding protein